MLLQNVVLGALLLAGSAAASPLENNYGKSTTKSTTTTSKSTTTSKTTTVTSTTKSTTSSTTKSTTVTASSCQTTTATYTTTATATTTSVNPTGSCFLYYGSFDQLTVTDPAAPYGNTIGFYDSINYEISLVQYDPTIGTGVIPNSGAYFGVFGQLTGPLLIGNGWSANYPQSTIYADNLFSFYYGCAAMTQESVIGLPIACTFYLTAFDVYNNQIAQQTFSFTPDSGLSSQMRYGALSSAFQQNNAYTYQLSFTTTAQLLTSVILVDSLLYSVCGNGSIAGNS